MEYKDYDYILMDTAGRSHKNKEQVDDLKEIMKYFSNDTVLTYLVLSATTKYKDLKKITELYSDISDYSLIFSGKCAYYVICLVLCVCASAYRFAVYRNHTTLCSFGFHPIYQA